MLKPKICLIAAVSENHVIAKDGRLPWRIPDDLKRFREKIDGRLIISGRKTFDKSYRNNINIVITRQEGYVSPISAAVVHSVDEALQLAQAKLMEVAEEKRDEIFIIGGGEIFKETINLADKLYLTLIHQKVEGDTYFPDYSIFTKKVLEETHESNGYRYTFIDLERKG